MVTMMNGWLKGLVPHRAGMTDGLFIVDIYIISDIYEKIMHIKAAKTAGDLTRPFIVIQDGDIPFILS